MDENKEMGKSPADYLKMSHEFQQETPSAGMKVVNYFTSDSRYLMTLAMPIVLIAGIVIGSEYGVPKGSIRFTNTRHTNWALFHPDREEAFCNPEGLEEITIKFQDGRRLRVMDSEYLREQRAKHRYLTSPECREDK